MSNDEIFGGWLDETEKLIPTGEAPYLNRQSFVLGAKWAEKLVIGKICHYLSQVMPNQFDVVYLTDDGVKNFEAIIDNIRNKKYEEGDN